MTVYIIVTIVALVFIYLFVCYNKFIKLNNQVKEAFSTMDVYLKKRWDLIPSIVETVKGYAKHESETLEKIVNARNVYESAKTDEEKVEASNGLTESIGSLFALAESYPELKANENFKDLSKELSKVEEDIANARKYYNGAVRVYNNKVEMFPSNIIAELFGYKSKTMFEANADERKNINVEL